METERHTSSEPRTVGLIGVGLMGAALAERLIGGGFDVLGYDVDPARRAALARPGGAAAASAGAVLSACPRVLLSLPDLDVVASVLSAEAAALRAGQLTGTRWRAEHARPARRRLPAAEPLQP